LPNNVSTGFQAEMKNEFKPLFSTGWLTPHVILCPAITGPQGLELELAKPRPLTKSQKVGVFPDEPANRERP
jgi:hypothetical protein